MSKGIFDDIAAGLEDAISIGRGEADPETYRVHVPRELDVRAIRRKLELTQEEFATAFGFPLSTLRDWEQGRARPDTSTRAYLLVISRAPKVVSKVLRSANDDGDIAEPLYKACM